MKQTLQVLLFIFLSTNLFAQKDSLLYELVHMNVYKNTENQTYTIRKGNKTIWKNLKFIAPTYGSYLQVLDNNNASFYIDDKGRKSKNLHVNIGLCGTVPHYTYEIIETAAKYVLTENETFYDYDNLDPPIEIASINKEGIQKIYFYNNERKMQMTSNDFIFNATKVFPQALVIEKDNKKGLFYDNELTFFDEIRYKDGIFKVKQNDLFGYYKITQPIYKELEEFSFGLARFKLANGKTGFIDKDGKEYYD